MTTAIQRSLAAVKRSIEKVGHTNGTIAPEFDPPRDAKRNNEQTARLHEQHLAAYEYLVASMGFSYFEKQRKTARELLDRLGMTEGVGSVRPGDPQQIIWGNEHMQLHVKINQPSTKVDVTALVSALRRKGVSHDIINACLEQATTTNKPPTFLNIVPVNENGGDAK